MRPTIPFEGATVQGRGGRFSNQSGESRQETAEKPELERWLGDRLPSPERWSSRDSSKGNTRRTW